MMMYPKKLIGAVFLAAACLLGIAAAAVHDGSASNVTRVTSPGGGISAIEVPPTSKRLLIAEIFNTQGNQSERSLLPHRLIALMDLAKAGHEDIEAWSVDDAADQHHDLLGTADFDTGSDNPYAPLPPGVAQQFLNQVLGNLGRQAPAPATDVPGALRLVATRAVEARNSGAQKVSAVLIGDGVSTVAGCDFGLAPLDPSTWPATAQLCLGTPPILLNGVNVLFANAGEDTSGLTDLSVSRAAPQIDEDIVTQAGGTTGLIDLDVADSGASQ